MPRTRSTHSKGFTLLEVLITTALLTLLIVGVLSSFTSAFVADRSAQQVISGRNLAQEVMESLEAVMFDNLLAMNGTTVVRDDLTAIVSVDQVATGLLRVEVGVTHADVQEVNLQIVTLVADRG